MEPVIGEQFEQNLNFELPQELRLLKDNLRRFVDRELIPIERDTCEAGRLKPEYQRRISDRAAELGLGNYDVPREYGGLGLGLLAKVMVWSELSRSIAIPSRGRDIFTANVSPILYHLDDEQKERFLLPTLRGAMKWCFAQSEPDAGGDPGNMRTTAVRQGDSYVLNGVKRFITAAGDADYGQVFAATDRAKGSRGGISLFLVDMKSPGVKLLRQQPMMMDDRPWEVAFDNVKVPVENRVGAEGDGFKFGQQWINVGRVRHGARGIGVMERCLELGASYAKQRVTFGRPLADRQAIQWMLVDSYMELHQLRFTVWHAAWKYDRGEDIRNEAYIAKIQGTTHSFRTADRCMQMFGGMGLTMELPIEKFWRDQRSMMITEGPIEILKTTLARQVLREFG